MRLDRLKLLRDHVAKMDPKDFSMEWFFSKNKNSPRGFTTCIMGSVPDLVSPEMTLLERSKLDHEKFAAEWLEDLVGVRWIAYPLSDHQSPICAEEFPENWIRWTIDDAVRWIDLWL